MGKTVVARIDLGYTRVAGFLIYDSETKEFQEITPRAVANLVMAHRVNGLVFDKDGELVPDREGWNLGNIKIRSGMGNYRDFNTNEPKGEVVYSVVRVICLKDDVPLFEVVNNKCARVFYTAKQLAALDEFNWVGGVRINHKDGEITTCKGVVIESIEDQQYIFEVGNSVYPKDNIAPAIDVNAYEQNNPISADASAQEQADFAFDEINDTFIDEPKTMEDIFKDAPVGSVSPVESKSETSEPARESETKSEEAESDDFLTDTLKEMYGAEKSEDTVAEEVESSEVADETTSESEPKSQNNHKSKKKHK